MTSVSDVAEVKEALERLPEAVFGGVSSKSQRGQDLQAVTDAARRWVRIVETGQQMGWCDTHNQRANMVIEKPACYHRLGCRVSQRLVLRP